MESSQDFKKLRDSIQNALVATTRTVNGLANEDLQFQRTVNPAVAKHLDEKSERLLGLANGLLRSAGKFTGQRASVLEDTDDIDIQWRGIVDVIDGLLEKTDTSLDDYTGLIKRKEAPISELGRDAKRPKSTLEKFMKRANILKPQDTFEKKVDNFDSSPWKPLLTTKPNAKLGLEESLVMFSDDENNEQYKHPYETEILSLQYPQQVYEKREPKKYLPIESTTAIWVDTWEGVLEMLEELKTATEIAVDLEHHDFRTYAGLLSLMQISTREKDWIVDTLVPWRHKLEILNEVFTDPNIVKVLHGAFMDIIWLQRDLGLYVVGIFDTFYACDALGYPGKGLAFLLKKFVDFDADKKYQMADWRIRPLPEEMFYYARCDTHYLLYIYDMVRNELVEQSDRNDPEKDLIEKVLHSSREVALQRYENPIYDVATGLGARGWCNPLLKSNAIYNGEQFAVYKAVHKWRDDLARRKDESPLFIMSQHVVAEIARILPTDKKALWSLLDGNAKSLRSHIDELFSLVQEARASGINGPTMLQHFSQEPTEIAKGFGSKQLKTTTEIDDNIPDIKELRSKRSQLWGDLPMSSVWDGTKKPPADDLIILSYPQQLQGAVNTTLEQPQKPVNAIPRTDGRQAADSVMDQEFTLRSGRKRKVDERESPPAPGSAGGGSESEMDLDEPTEPADDTAGFVTVDEGSEVSGSDQSDGEKVSKKEKKKQKREAKKAKVAAKAAKKAKKAEKKAAREREQTTVEAGAKQEEEYQPFDYSKAESVLHAPKTNGGGPGRGKKAFNPYSDKSGDAPKAARKLGLVKAGKTATFKK